MLCGRIICKTFWKLLPWSFANKTEREYVRKEEEKREGQTRSSKDIQLNQHADVSDELAKLITLEPLYAATLGILQVLCYQKIVAQKGHVES